MRSTDADRQFYSLPNSTPICTLNVRKAFDGLTEKERRYAYHMSRASWLGTFIVQQQVSVEAPVIAAMLFKMVTAQDLDSLKKVALSTCGLTEEDWTVDICYWGN